MLRVYSYYMTIAAVARVASAQWWNGGSGNSWPFGGGNSCPSLQGCRLAGNNRNRNYLNYQENISAGTYTMECDVGRGTIGYVTFQYNGATNRDASAPYKLRNVKLDCGKTAQVTVTGSTWWGSQCFQRDYTFNVGSCNTNQCNYSCPQDSRSIQSCPRSFQDCRCNRGFRSNGRECLSNCYSCPENSASRSWQRCPRSFQDCPCSQGFRADWVSEKCVSQCYVCPENSVARNRRSCPRSFRDCQCSQGAQRDWGLEKCVAPSCRNYQCPFSSMPINGRSCIESFDDCECQQGLTKAPYGDRCVRGVNPLPSPIARPPPVPRPVSVPQPVPQPVRVPQPVPQPVRVPQPVPQPVRVPQPVPQPVPVPIPVPTPSLGLGQIVPTKCEVRALVELMEESVREEQGLAAQWLRLSFHDAGTFNQNTGVGGANGCLLTDDRMREQTENDFLDLALDPLQRIRDRWTGRASAADLIQFAGFFAVIRQKDQPGLTQFKRGELENDFLWGRADERSCQPSWTDNLPGFELGTEPIEDVPRRCMMAGKEIKAKMMDRNGFSALEATALIGAHTIGLTRNIFTEELAGPWSRNGADDFSAQGPVFDNGFHSFLISEVQGNNMRTVQDFAENRSPFTTDFPTWFRFDDADINHLDTDIVLAFPSQNTREHPDFHRHTRRFANNNRAFMRQFMLAFEKMSKLGNALPLFPSAECTLDTSRIFSASTPVQFRGVPFRLELEGALAEAEQGRRETANKRFFQTQFLTTPVNIP